jgi:hypothetical protein
VYARDAERSYQVSSMHPGGGVLERMRPLRVVSWQDGVAAGLLRDAARRWYGRHGGRGWYGWFRRERHGWHGWRALRWAGLPCWLGSLRALVPAALSDGLFLLDGLLCKEPVLAAGIC